MSRSAMTRQVKSHQVKGWGQKGRHLEWNAPPRLVLRVTLSHVPALSSQPWRRRHLATPVNVFQQKFTVDLYCIFNCCTRHTWWTASPSFCSKATPRKIKCHLKTPSIIGISSSLSSSPTSLHSSIPIFTLTLSFRQLQPASSAILTISR